MDDRTTSVNLFTQGESHRGEVGHDRVQERRQGATMTGDRRHQRSTRTRQALIDAALELFEERGFDATTVQQIAETAGVAERTFFHHFRTKEAVLFGGYAERLADAIRRLRGASADTALWRALEQAAGAVVEVMASQPDLFLRRSRLYADVPALRAAMVLINEEWIDGIEAAVADRTGAAAGDLRPRLIAAMANGTMRAAIDTWVASDGRRDLAALFAEGFALVRPAIVEIEATWATTAPVPVDG
jgi:AcrR family transcriptional regulator